jgi:molybdate transport system permease protein
MLGNYQGSTVFVSHNLEETYRVCGDLVVLAQGSVAASGPKEEIFRRPPTLEVARLTGCKNFSRALRTPDGRINALDWDCVLNVSQQTAAIPGHIAIRAHHIRLHAPGELSQDPENIFPCWLAAMAETPFRVTLDLKIGGPPRNPADFHVQAEVFKQEWESFCNLQQPWQAELSADRLFLLSG